MGEQKRTKKVVIAKANKKKPKKATNPSVVKTTRINKNRVLKALEKRLGVVSDACKDAEVCRTTFYEWCREDPDFKQRVDDVGEITKDFIECQGYKLIKLLHPATIMFYLKTKCRDRGYIEKSEISYSGSLDVSVSELTDQQLAAIVNGSAVRDVVSSD